MATDDVYRVTISALYLGSVQQNVYAVQLKTETAPTATIFQTFATAAVNMWLGVQINSCVYREVHARNMHVAGAAQGNYTFPSGVTGQRGGFPVADNEASGITKRTGFTGRSNRGRNSISGFSEADLDGNTIGNTLMTLLGDLAIHILTSYLAGRFLPAVASRANHIAVPLATTVVLDNNVDSQKTRLNTHGT